MSIKFYPKFNGSEEGCGFTAEELRKNIHFVYADYECPECNKIWPVPIGNICPRCNRQHD